MSAALMFAAAVLATKGLTLGPTGFYQFCQSHPDACRVEQGLPVAPVDMLQAINAKVNAIIAPKAEAGEADTWSISPAAGDCEDYALTKRALAMQAGIASSAARIAVGRLRNGERHAVLVVSTATGEVVLDNLTNRIVPVSESHMRFDAIQAPQNPGLWLAVRD